MRAGALQTGARGIIMKGEKEEGRRLPRKGNAMGKIYDVAILGAGPAGLTAGIYAGRARLSTLLLERGQDGGQIALTGEIANYPGQLPGDSGSALIARMSAQCAAFGVERVSDTIVRAELSGGVKRLAGERGTYEARTLIIACGASARRIGCRNEERFIGSGISFCATCDAAFFEGLDVYVVGGGDAAVEEALYLTKFARRVTIIHRRGELRAARSLQEKALRCENLSVLWNTVVEEVGGGDVLSQMLLKNTVTGERTRVEASPADGMFGLFGFVGLEPKSGLFADTLALEDGYIRTDEEMRTAVPGVFATGDIRVKSLRQVVTAAADGAVAAVQAEKYLAEAEKT